MVIFIIPSSIIIDSFKIADIFLSPSTKELILIIFGILSGTSFILINIAIIYTRYIIKQPLKIQFPLLIFFPITFILIASLIIITCPILYDTILLETVE